MFILDQRQNGFDVSRWILVGVIGVTAIRESNGLANDHTRALGTVLKTDVEIGEKQIRGGSLRAAKFFEGGFFDDDEAVGQAHVDIAGKKILVDGNFNVARSGVDFSRERRAILKL